MALRWIRRAGRAMADLLPLGAGMFVLTLYGGEKAANDPTTRAGLFFFAAAAAILAFQFRLAGLVGRLADEETRMQIAVTLRRPEEEIRARMHLPLARALAGIWLVLPLLAVAEYQYYGRYQLPRDRWTAFLLQIAIAAILLALAANQALNLAARLFLNPKGRLIRTLWSAAIHSAPLIVAWGIALLAVWAHGLFQTLAGLLLFHWLVYLLAPLPLAWSRACAAHAIFEPPKAGLKGLEEEANPSYRAALRNRRIAAWRRIWLLPSLLLALHLCSLSGIPLHAQPSYLNRTIDAQSIPDHFETALRIVGEGIKRMPRDERLYAFRANLLQNQGKLGEALEASQRAAALKPRDPVKRADMQKQLGGSYVNVGEHEKARAAFREGIRLLESRIGADPSRDLYIADLLALIGLSYSLEGRYAEALGEHEAALRINAGQTISSQGRADCLMALGREEEARLQYLECADLWVGTMRNGAMMRGILLFKVAFIHLRRGEWQAAFDLASRANSLRGNHGANWLVRAIAADKLGMGDRARESYRRWLALKGQNEWRRGEAPKLLPESLRHYIDAMPGMEGEMVPPAEDWKLPATMAELFVIYE